MKGVVKFLVVRVLTVAALALLIVLLSARREARASAERHTS